MLRDVASDQQSSAASGFPWSSIATRASRLGVSTQALDDTLYDAFGQRQVSTIFTQLNLYRVILEVDAGVPTESRRPCARSTCARPTATPVPLDHLRPLRARRTPPDHRPPGAVPGGDPVLQPGARRGSLGDAVSRHRRRHGSRSDLPPSVHAVVSRHGQGLFANRWPASPSSSSPRSSPSTSCSAFSTRATSTPSPFSRTLPSAGVGALLALHRLSASNSASSRSSASSCSSASSRRTPS